MDAVAPGNVSALCSRAPPHQDQKWTLVAMPSTMNTRLPPAVPIARLFQKK
jgi:hypothetical protein